jgi:hypothetical protein
MSTYIIPPPHHLLINPPHSKIIDKEYIGEGGVKSF